MTILSIDPGPTESAFCVITNAGQPLQVGKVPNDDLRFWPAASPIFVDVQHVAIEMVSSYGMPVGREVFETCVWIGRFMERSPIPVELVYRRDVKLHHCHSAKAKDANVIQALVDRFAPGAPNRGKGTKAEPGWFYGFTGDIWQAYALAVYVADIHAGAEGAA